MTNSILTGTPVSKPGAENETTEQKKARAILRPDVNGAATIEQLSRARGLDLATVVDCLAEQSEAVNNGDLKRAESMLITQAHTLDAIFNNLAQHALQSGNLDKLDRYMRLAMKTQNQCRATLQTLGELKNPRSVAFVKQANIANGPQQVNNGMNYPDVSHAHAAKNQTEQNELLEVMPSEQLDTRAPSASGSVDSQLETVGAIDGTADSGR